MDRAIMFKVLMVLLKEHGEFFRVLAAIRDSFLEPVPIQLCERNGSAGNGSTAPAMLHIWMWLGRDSG